MAITSKDTTITFNAQAIGEVNSIGGPGGTAPIIDVSHLGSAAVAKLLGLPDEGQCTLECNYVSADVGQVACRTARASGSDEAVVITLSDSSTLSFDAFCLGFAIASGVNKQVTVTITLEITGAVTFG